jgi:hypothetical protein
MNELRKCGIYIQWNLSAIKKNEILSFACKWMELENIILSEGSQAQKTKGCMFSLIMEYRPNINTSNVMKNRLC